MLRFIASVLLFFLPLMGETTLPQLQQELRVALVIANGNYDGTHLEHAVANGRKMRDFLELNNFKVIYAENVNKREFVRLIREFDTAMKPNCLSLFYYNGHAAQLEGENMLIPIASTISTDKHLGYQAIPVDTVSTIMRKAFNRLNIVILDALTPEAFTTGYQPKKQGLAPLKAQQHTHFILSQQPEAATRISDFSERFIDTYHSYPIDIRTGIDYMREHTRGDAQPWAIYDAKERFFFELPARLDVTDAMIWKKVREAHTLETYEAFLREYPRSHYLKDARAAIESVKKELAEAQAHKHRKEEEAKHKAHAEIIVRPPPDITKEPAVKPLDAHQPRNNFSIFNPQRRHSFRQR